MSTSGPATVRPRDHLFTAVGIGLVTGLIEVLAIVLKWTLLRQFAWTGINVLWMAPLYYLALFSALGVVLAAAAGLSGARLPYAVTIGACGALGAFAVLLTLFYGRMAIVSLSIIALGIGVQSGRLAGRRQTLTALHMRRVALGASLATVVLAGGLPLLLHLRERYRAAHLAPAREGAANVVLIILDTVRAASLSLYGYERPTTPHLDRRAANGTVFERAIAPSSWTLPSHAAVFTGTSPQFLSANWLTPLGPAHATLAEALQRRGYRTGGFVSNLYYTSRESGLGRGFQHYKDYRTSWGQFLLSTAFGQYLRLRHRSTPPPRRLNDRKIGEAVSQEFLDWVDQDGTRPFFAFLNYYDAHQTYRAIPPWRQRFADSSNRARGNYDASIAHLDVVIDTLFQALADRGILDNTLVILTSDHGELIGEHGMKEHGNSLYDLVLHVPLVLWYPGRVPADRRIPTPVTLQDLGTTILDLATGDTGGFPGVSLRGAWQDSSWRGSPILSHIRKGINTPPEEPVSRGDMFGMYQGGWHYILNGDGVPELYDLAEDPDEAHNLAQDRCCLTRRQDMALALERLRGDSLSLPRGHRE